MYNTASTRGAAHGWSSKDQCNLRWFDPVTVSALQIISSSVADMNAWHVDKDSARSSGFLAVYLLHGRIGRRVRIGPGEFILWLPAFPVLRSRYPRSVVCSSEVTLSEICVALCQCISSAIVRLHYIFHGKTCCLQIQKVVASFAPAIFSVRVTTAATVLSTIPEVRSW